MKEKTDLTQEEEIQKSERVKQKCFKERRLKGKELNSVVYSQLKSIPSMDYQFFSPNQFQKK